MSTQWDTHKGIMLNAKGGNAEINAGDGRYEYISLLISFSFSSGMDHLSIVRLSEFQ